MFSITSLKCFAVAAEELNFTRAAKRLYITQQALSNHIAKLEQYFGIKLFDRGNPLTLTEAGRALQTHAQKILSSVDDYAREVQDIKDFHQGELTIGIPVTRGTIMLPPLLSDFHRMFSQIKLTLVEGTSSGNITDALYDGTADLCICYQPSNTRGLIVTPLYEESFVLVVPNQLLHQTYPQYEQDCAAHEAHFLREFARLPFVAQSPDTKNGQTFQELCAAEEIEPNVVVVTQNLITELSLCLEGLGACVLPGTFIAPLQEQMGRRLFSLFSEKQIEQLSFFLLKGLPNKPMISVCRLKDKSISRAGREFIQLAQRMYGQPSLKPHLQEKAASTSFLV